MTKKKFDEESATLLPAALIVEGQRCFGTKGLLSMLEEKPVYAEHPNVKQYEKPLRWMASATIVTELTRGLCEHFAKLGSFTYY